MVGLICVLVYVCSRIYATAMYQAGLWSFSQLKSGSPTAKYEEHGRAIDFSLWTGKRVKTYKQALAVRVGACISLTWFGARLMRAEPRRLKDRNWRLQLHGSR